MIAGDPDVLHAVVRPFRDEAGLSYMVAYVVAADPESFKLSNVRTRIAHKLVDFMIPEFFVLMDHIPLTTNGKPDAATLPQVLKE